MLRNLFKISFRNLRKDKGYSFINVLGLTIGITCSLFLLVYILDELSYDRYHKNGENIYRIISNIKEPDNAFTWTSTQNPLAPELRDKYPEVIDAVRIRNAETWTFKLDDKEFKEDDFFFADSTYFEMFTHEFIAGDPRTALDNPFSIVLTETTAHKYFASPQEALSQSIQNQLGEQFKITGVIKDVPRNGHRRFSALISWNTRKESDCCWGGFGLTTYIQLPQGYDLSKMQASLDKIIKEKVNPQFEKAGIKVNYGLQRITDIHLYSKIQDEAESGGDISYIYIFSAIAVFMLVIACINYMNLATARSANRAKEVGIRKVMGSERKQLMLQFIVESVVVTLISLVVSLMLIWLLLPAFNTICNKEIPFAYLLQSRVMLSLVGIVLFTGIVGGSYPAFYLSGFNPISVLKGKVSARGGSLFFRRSLVVVQFALSIFMLISTIIVFDQLRFLRTTDLGFDKDQVVRLQLTRTEQGRNAQILMDKLRNNTMFTDVAMAQAAPGENIGKGLFQVEDADGKMVERGVDLFDADYDWIRTLKMKIVAGRDFSRDIPSDSIKAVLVNESMVRRMAWKDPIGKRFTTGDGPNDFKKEVVGVIKDYHQNSLYDQIEPMMVVMGTRFNNNIFVRLNSGDPTASVETLRKAWTEVFPHHPFEYTFLDQDFDSQYKADQKRSQLFTLFSGLTVFIACLGLLGLAAFTTEQRTKEIGIRKVVGADITGLVILVSKEFFVLVGIGMIVAFPAAWYFTSNWLTNFAYRIQLGDEWTTFMVSTLLAFAITVVTVGFHVVRSAQVNPVQSLRQE